MKTKKLQVQHDTAEERTINLRRCQWSTGTPDEIAAMIADMEQRWGEERVSDNEN